MKTVLPRAICKAIVVRLGAVLLLLFFFHSLSYGQLTCATAVQLYPASSCTNTNGTANGASNSGVAAPTCAGGTIRRDVWYYFQATSTNPTITINVTGARFQNNGSAASYRNLRRIYQFWLPGGCN